MKNFIIFLCLIIITLVISQVIDTIDNNTAVDNIDELLLLFYFLPRKALYSFERRNKLSSH